jgi:Domain of unknown function (DUF5134)
VTMGGPAWLSDLLALITLVVSGYCLGRLVVSRTRRRPTDVDVDLVHGAMGVGMAAMLVPGISPLPEVTWAWAFGVAAAWLAWRIVSAGNIRIARAHYLPHLVMAVGMIYMGAAASIPARGAGAGSGTAMGGPGTAAHFPLGALILALFMFGYAVWVLDQLPAIATVRALRAAPPLVLAASAVLVPVAAVGGSSPGSAVLDRPVPLSPRLEAGCHIAMAVVMGYLLILMV